MSSRPNWGLPYSSTSSSYDWDDGIDETVAAIRWYEIDARTSAVVQSGTYGEPGTSYFLPHITTDGDRTLMSYNVSGPERYPSLEVTGRTAGFTQGTMEAAVEIQRGYSSVIHPTGFGRRGDDAPVYWSDETGISVHPTTGRFWVTGPYSPAVDVPLDGEKPDQHQSHIAEVSFGTREKGQ